VVVRPSGFTDPANAAPFGPVTVGVPVVTGDGGAVTAGVVGVPVITGDGGAVIAAKSATVEPP
jgi:hypothetical protein